MDIRCITSRLVNRQAALIAFAKIERDQVLDRLFEVFRAKDITGQAWKTLQPPLA